MNATHLASVFLDRRGAALPMAMLTLLILSVLIIGFSVLSATEPTIANNQLRVTQARAVAEAGVERAMWALNRGITDPAMPTGSPTPFVGTASRPMTAASSLRSRPAAMRSGDSVSRSSMARRSTNATSRPSAGCRTTRPPARRPTRRSPSPCSTRNSSCGTRPLPSPCAGSSSWVATHSWIRARTTAAARSMARSQRG